MTHPSREGGGDMDSLTPRVEGAMTQAARDVLAERLRQQSIEGWTTENDDQHSNGQMADAAAWYAATEAAFWITEGDCPVDLWPWSEQWRKPTSRRRDLIKAGALILAEIERLDRASANASKDRGVSESQSHPTRGGVSE